MIALQLGFLDGEPLLWGETAVGPRPTKTRRKVATTHPFAADVDAIREGLAETISIARDRVSTATIWLPAVADRPVGSHPLIAEPPGPDQEIHLIPWSVPTVPLASTALLELLAACADQDTLRPGVLVGSTLRYWAAALRFGAGLVAQERFLPGVTMAGESPRARWEPVIGGVERTRFQRLADAMPAACRAITPNANTAPKPPPTILTEFLTFVVDTLVRASLPKLPDRKSFDSVHDQWLHALRTADGRMTLAKAETTELTRTVAEWQRPITVSRSAAYRLCFRLEEPEETANATAATARGTWTARYLLQAHDDLSLLVPLTDAWAAKKRVDRTVPLPNREFLLTALGQASKLCPEVEASLKSANPTGFTTDTPGAHRFLSETAYLLEQAGFGVLLPAWWARTGTKNSLAVTGSAKTAKKFSSGSNGLMSLDEVVKFDWKVAIGDTELTLAELEALANLKSPLVNVRGRWVQVNADEIRSALDFWRKNPQTSGTIRDLLKMSVGAEVGPAGLRVRGVKTTGGLKAFLDQLRGEASFAELPSPEAFRGTLRPYQLRGYSWLTFLRRVGLGACLADDMGLGKSVQTLAALQQARDEGETRPVLLACPTSVIGHWRKEAERFTPALPVMVHHGGKRAKGESFGEQVKNAGLVVSSFPLLYRDAEILKGIHWAGVILDEAQNIKNPDSKTSQAARGLKADFRVALTGTPVENHVGDLWAIGQFLNPGFLGTREGFRRTYLVPIQMQRDEEATRRLKELTGPFLLRRLKTDKSIISDLPDKFEAKVFCTLTKEQATLYQAVVGELDKSLDDEDGIRRKGQILGALSKLKQVCNHPAQFLGDNSAIPDRSGKLARLTEMLDEVLQAGDRALVFSQFTEMGEILKKHLQETFGKEVLFLHGGIPQPQRERMVSRFQDTAAPDSPRIFLISLKAGGTGLTLTAANHVFHFDRWWNPAVENQATDRAFRIGQKRNVQVHKFVCVGTLEEKIDEMIELKKELAGRVVGTGEGWLTEMSNTELKDLLALRASAVEE